MAEITVPVGGLPPAVFAEAVARWPYVHRVYADLGHPERLGAINRPLVGSERVLRENPAVQPCALSNFGNSPDAKPFWRQAWFFPDGALFQGHMTLQGDLIVSFGASSETDLSREVFGVVRWDGLGFLCDASYFCAYWVEILRFLNNTSTANLMEIAPPFYIQGANWNEPRDRTNNLSWEYKTGGLVTFRTAPTGLLPLEAFYRPYLFQDLLPLLRPVDLHDLAVALDVALQSPLHRELVAEVPFLLRALEDGVLHPSAWYLRSMAAAVASFKAGHPVEDWGHSLVPTAVATESGRLPTGFGPVGNWPGAYFMEMGYNEGEKKLVWQRAVRNLLRHELIYSPPYYRDLIGAWPRIRASITVYSRYEFGYHAQALTDVVAPQWSRPVEERGA